MPLNCVKYSKNNFKIISSKEVEDTKIKADRHCEIYIGKDWKIEKKNTFPSCLFKMTDTPTVPKELSCEIVLFPYFNSW